MPAGVSAELVCQCSLVGQLVSGWCQLVPVGAQPAHTPRAHATDRYQLTTTHQCDRTHRPFKAPACACVSRAVCSAVNIAEDFLPLPFVDIFSYMFLLRAGCQAVRPAGRRAMLYLAAAVSDFYIPEVCAAHCRGTAAAGGLHRG